MVWVCRGPVVGLEGSFGMGLEWSCGISLEEPGGVGL
jgi:hypothetical protein